MKRFFKTLFIISSVLTVFIYTAVIYGANSLPDEISFSDIDSSRLSGFYSAGTGNNIRAVSSGSEGFGTKINALGIIPVKNIKVNLNKRRYVGLGGDVFGIKMYTEGIIVIGVDSVTTANGNLSPANEAGIRSGDIIMYINGIKAESADEMTKTIENSGGSEIKLTAERNGEIITLGLKPVLSSGGKYKAGLWVRDSSAGIGTITFYDDERRFFGGLGHGVCDIDTGRIMPLSNGQAVSAAVNGYYKSSAGNPGELCGIFSDKSLGSLRANLESGIFGELEYASGAKQIPVALESEVKEGAAQIVTTVDSDGPKYYDVEITKIYPLSDRSTRNMIIKITDPELLEKTGGIVQGMSGSPIVQNSMLVGAVTHVFVNEPSQGYGIFASRMVDSLDSVIEEKLQKAS